MPIEVFTAASSGNLTLATGDGKESAPLEYFVTGTSDRDAAATAVINQLPFVIRSRLVPRSLKLQPHGDSIDVWKASVEYLEPAKIDRPKQMPRAIGQATWSFDATGGTTRITECPAGLGGQTTYGTNAPDADSQINIIDGKAEGVEIVIPQLTLTINQKFAGATLTLPWVKAFANMIGTHNDATFLGFAAGELLLIGGNGTQPVAYNNDGSTAFGERDVTFQFAYSENRTDLSFAGAAEFTSIEKKGHDYIWFAYEVVENTDSLKGKLIGVYVATVYDESDFSTLGIVNPDTNPGGV